MNKLQSYTCYLAMIGALLCCCAQVSQATSFVNNDSQQVWHTQGSGTYRWFGIKIYDAKLLVAPKFNGDFKQARPIALEITYDIDIDKNDLIETTLEEWESLEIGKSQTCQNQQLWAKQLEQVWPNLKQGDKLRLEIDIKNQASFYYNDDLTGAMQDVNFGTCFLAIWLDKDSSAPGLRKKLLNLKR